MSYFTQTPFTDPSKQPQALGQALMPQDQLMMAQTPNMSSPQQSVDPAKLAQMLNGSNGNGAGLDAGGYKNSFEAIDNPSLMTRLQSYFGG